MKTEGDLPVLPPAAPEVDVLAAGDLLEIIFTRTNAGQTGPYLLQVGDVISVDVADQPDISAKDMRVLPDGRVAMRVIGSIPVAGRSVEQAGQLIATGLERKNVPSPEVIVSVQSANQRLEQFLRSAAPDTQGGRLQIRLAAGEQVSLPLIGVIPAVSRPLDAVRDEIVAAYRRMFGAQLNITVNLREQAEPQVFVWGEVTRPGTLPLKSRMNSAMAIAAAGGPTAVANRSQVLVVRFRPDGGFYHWTVDLDTIESAERSPGFNIALRNRDIVYVGRSRVGDVNEFIDVYLRKNVPLPLGLGFTP